MSSHDRREREAHFWDARAHTRDEADLAAEDSVLRAEPLFRFLEQAVANAGPHCLLDAGCGSGVGTARLAAQCTRVVGIDVAAAPLMQGSEYLRACGLAHKVELLLSPAESLPFRDASFDVVVGYFVLHHLADLEQGLSELKRVLKPGGRAWFVETWSRNRLLSGLRRVAAKAGINQGSPDERPLGAAQLAVIRQSFTRVRFHYPSLDLLKYIHLPMLWLDRRLPVVKPLVRAVWNLPVRADGLLHAHLPWLRPYGWHVVLELETSS